ncbi:hypothetical protein [Luethyella okanaganae]|uniref:Phage tail protein n=1 Tax=Luethyella okanaganae TaxID=69372 RepID=A0ABW1VCB7_9MICO
MSSSIMVTTASSIEAVVTAEFTESRIEITATAVCSDATRAFDQEYERDLSLYLEQARLKGISSAGLPPRNGAEAYLSEITITPPDELRGIGKLVCLTGGTGTEWVRRWIWNNCRPQRGWSFAITLEGQSTMLLLE